MAHRALAVFLTLCSFGILAADSSSTEPFGLRLVGGASRCQGRLEVERQGQSWTPVAPWYCYLQLANRVCAEVGCASAVSVSVRRESNSLRDTPEIDPDCEETSLSDCFRPNTVSSAFSVDLNCSDSVRLRGPRLCSGSLEVHQDQSWTPVCEGDFDLQDAEVLCRELGCGAPSLLQGALYGEVRALGQTFLCEGHESALMDCPRSSSENTCSSGTVVNLTCSEPVRLVGGASRCAGAVELELRGQWRRMDVWFGDWDLEATAAVCRDLDCGSAVSGERRHGFPQRPVWGVTADCVKKSALRECVWDWDNSRTRGLEVVCSEPVRLVGGASRCAGAVELELRGQWRRMDVWFGDWDLEATAAVCRDLDCGSAVSGERRYDFLERPVWEVTADCVKKSTLRNCVEEGDSSSTRGLEVVCSDLLTRPNISLSVSADGVSEAQPQGLRVLLGSDFSVRCSVEPQYPGGSFQLLSPTVDPAQSHTLPAVNHSAHFLFSDAGSAHKGGYTCVYHLHVFSHDFSSRSHTLHLSLGALDSELIIRVVLILLLKIIYISALYYYCKFRATRGHQRRRQRAPPEDHTVREEEAPV